MEAEAATAAAAFPDGAAPPAAAAAAPAIIETLPQDAGALVWVQYMRFLRRTGECEV